MKPGDVLLANGAQHVATEDLPLLRQAADALDAANDEDTLPALATVWHRHAMQLLSRLGLMADGTPRP